MAESKPINVDEVVNYLNRAFSKATSKASAELGNKAIRQKNHRGVVEKTALYDFQVEFSYLIDNIQRGPGYIRPKVIQQANDLIHQVEEYKAPTA